MATLIRIAGFVDSLMLVSVVWFVSAWAVLMAGTSRGVVNVDIVLHALWFCECQI